MPALTRRGKRQLPRDLEEDEDGSEGEMLTGILAQRARRREAAQERGQEEQQTDNQVRGVMVSWTIIDDMFLISQDPTEDDLNGEDGVGQPPTPPQSSPGPQEGDGSRSSSPTFPRRPTVTPSPSSSPEPRMPARSTAQQSAVGRSQPRQQQTTQMPNANELSSSSQGSRGPPVPPAPPTLNPKSQASKTKKPAPKRRKRNW